MAHKFASESETLPSSGHSSSEHSSSGVNSLLLGIFIVFCICNIVGAIYLNVLVFNTRVQLEEYEYSLRNCRNDPKLLSELITNKIVRSIKDDPTFFSQNLLTVYPLALKFVSETVQSANMSFRDITILPSNIFATLNNLATSDFTPLFLNVSSFLSQIALGTNTVLKDKSLSTKVSRMFFDSRRNS